MGAGVAGLVIAAVAFVGVLALSRTEWARKRARTRGYQTAMGGPGPRALWTGAAIALFGVLVAVATHDLYYLAALVVAAGIGLTRYIRFRRTGVWR
jgi:hypothetical protein